MFDVAYVLSVFNKTSKNWSAAWLVFLAPIATCGVIALIYVVFAKDAKVRKFPRWKSLFLSIILMLSMVAGFMGTTRFFYYPVNRQNWFCWMLAALNVSASIIAARQIARLTLK